jgi:serine/threonine-protein kinase
MTVGKDAHPRIPDRIPPEPDITLSWERLQERSQLGSGETADVVEMRVDGADETVAVKQPRLESTLQTETVDRFVEEAETWQKLDDHDHIVGVVDWGEQPLPWIALEHMDGGSLADRVGRLSTEKGLWVGACAAAGVWSTHRRGVAHLDLKPENILFRTTGSRTWDVPKVSDWGLARLLLEESSGVEGFSPRYAAPEQLEPGDYGRPNARTDVYQLGTIVYELLTAEPVFDGAARTVIDRHLNAEPTPPTDVDATLPSAVDDVVLAALAKEKDDRYESMLDFRRDLESLFARVASDAIGSSGYGDMGTASTGQRLDPLESGPGTTRDESGSSGSKDDLGGGSSIEAGSDGTRILDRIRKQTQVDPDRQIPWQERYETPDSRSSDTDEDLDEQPTDVDSTPDVTTSNQDQGGDGSVYGAGLLVGLFISGAAIIGGAPLGLLIGVPLTVGSVWKLSTAQE